MLFGLKIDTVLFLMKWWTKTILLLIFVHMTLAIQLEESHDI